MFMRVIIAVVAVVFLFLLIPPVTRLLGVPLSGDFEIVLRLCIAAIALFYIIRGYPPVAVILFMLFASSADAQTIRLEWPNPEPSCVYPQCAVGGYSVCFKPTTAGVNTTFYAGNCKDAFDTSRVVFSDGSRPYNLPYNTAFYLHTNHAPGTRVYFRVIAYGQRGRASLASGEVNAIVPTSGVLVLQVPSVPTPPVP